MNQQSFRLTISEVYKNLYQWRTIDEFLQVLKSTIAYKSEDNSVIALSKPFGVGTYNVYDENSTKQNQDKILYNLCGSPRYCLKDALEPLTDEFSPTRPYQVLKSIDRYLSGLVLITNDPKKNAPLFMKALTNSRIHKQPPYGFRAITSGYPGVCGKRTYEKVGMSLIEVDEFGDYKEPIIEKKVTKKHDLRSIKDKTTFQAEMEVKSVNREYSTALVELYVSKLQWDFPRCYLSSKTSFILGDVRFSKRIREILGKPIQVSAFKSSHRYEDNYEPLNSRLRKVLGVAKNSSIPLMLDLHTLRLKGFGKKDLCIQAPIMPLHFALTAEQLNLLDNT